MKSSDNLAALIYLKSKVHKWKNIALLLIIFSTLLAIKFTFGDRLSDGLVEGPYIASIKIENVIFEDDYRSRVLKEISKNNSIKAVIVNVDSPGGGIVGSEVLFDDLREIAENKPIVVLMGSVAASGGYLVATASDYIIAHNGTLTGSIGVLMESPEITELASKIGVKFNNYKSSPLKGSPSPFEKSNPMVDHVINESIADSYKFFVDLVRERRGDKINKNLAHAIFDGRVFTGRQALQAGLIDEVGGMKEVLEYLESNKINTKELPIRDIELVERREKFFDRFLNILPFFNHTKSLNHGKQIMAVME